MSGSIRTMLKLPGIRYLIVGGSIYGLELIVIVLALYWGASNALAVGFSFWIGVAVSFLLQKLFTFGDKRMRHKILLPQIIAVSLLVLFNFGFTLAVTGLLQDYVPAVVTRTIALGLTTIWNFYLYKTRIFKSETVVIG